MASAEITRYARRQRMLQRVIGDAHGGACMRPVPGILGRTGIASDRLTELKLSASLAGKRQAAVNEHREIGEPRPSSAVTSLISRDKRQRRQAAAAYRTGRPNNRRGMEAATSIARPVAGLGFVQSAAKSSWRHQPSSMRGEEQYPAPRPGGLWPVGMQGAGPASARGIARLACIIAHAWRPGGRYCPGWHQIRRCW